MTQEEIKKRSFGTQSILDLAREAGLQLAINAETYPVITQQLTRFTTLIRNAALEEAAKAIDKRIDDGSQPIDDWDNGWLAGNVGAASKIRALKEK